MYGVLDEKKYLYNFLPYSMPVLCRIISDKFSEIIKLGNMGIAVMGSYDELFIFLYDADNAIKVLKKIITGYPNVRIILYTKQKIDLMKVKDDYIITEENFFVCNTSNFIKKIPAAGCFAGDEDIATLIKLEKKYIDEEIGWRKEERKTDLETKYRDKIDKRHVFIDGRPIRCKIEIKSQFRHYIEIGGIYTDIPVRQKGIAAHCLQSFLLWAAQRQLTVILNTRRNNAGGNKLYRSSGFTGIGSVYYIMERGQL